MRKFGFTLAEVLITLGIIGVVAAVTMPTLVMNTKYKEVGTRLAKFHNNLENAARSYTAANGDFSVKDSEKRDSSLKDFFNNSFIYKETYIKGKQTTDNSIDYYALITPSGGQIYKNLCIGNITSSQSCGILKDDSSIAYTGLSGSALWTMDDTKYSAEKYGEGVATVFFSPNVTGLPEKARKVYAFKISSKGIVVPAKQDTCLENAYNSNYVVNASWYKSGGACYNQNGSSSQQDPES